MDERPRNKTEKLIREVQSRPLLWDKYHDLHYNREATDREWLDLSLLMNTHKDTIRQKWKNLRDQFQREFKKTPPLDGGSVSAYLANYTGKWIYFEQMLFLKDSVKIKQYSHSTEEVEIPEDTTEEVTVFEEEPLIKVEDGYSLNENNPLLQSPVEIQVLPSGRITNNRQSEDEISEEVGRKRKASAEPEDRPKRKRNNLAEDPEEIDGDLYFFKSLLPFMRKLNPVRKLIVRNEIQTILLRESLCEKCNENSK